MSKMIRTTELPVEAMMVADMILLKTGFYISILVCLQKDGVFRVYRMFNEETLIKKNRLAAALNCVGQLYSLKLFALKIRC